MYRRLSSLALLAIIIFSLASVAQASDVQSSWTCWQTPRLSVGSLGRVTTYPNLPNRVRSIPSFSGRVLGYIPAGATFNVISGSQCASGVNWWQVSYNGITGWTGEGDGNYTYWLEPAGIVPPPPSCALPNRLTVGALGRVTPGLPNVVRSAPGTQRTGANSTVIGQIPGGGVFAVSGGPQCGTDGRWWWYVDYNGLIGWTAEGEGYNNYWLEPWYNGGATTCPYFLPSRLVAGGWGRVNQVPYNPVAIYSTSSFGGSVVGQIPRYGVFNVITGPTCADNTAWWQVNYNGYVGWVVEGNGSSYWLEPS